jgi:hypothetical protein
MVSWWHPPATRTLGPVAESGGDAVSEERGPSKDELLAALRASRDEVLAIVRALPPERLEEGRYEAGWNGRQILAHVASIEWTYPKLIEIASEAEAASLTASGDTGAGELPTRAMRGGNETYNARQVAKRDHLSVAELLLEFERNRAATIKAVDAAAEPLFGVRIRSAGGVTGTLAAVFYRVAVAHVLGHARDIAGIV